MRLGEDSYLSKQQMKRLVIKHGCYTNEYDLEELLKRLECEEVSLKRIKEWFKNDELVYVLRMVGRPESIVSEIRKWLKESGASK